MAQLNFDGTVGARVEKDAIKGITIPSNTIQYSSDAEVSVYAGSGVTKVKEITIGQNIQGLRIVADLKVDSDNISIFLYKNGVSVQYLWTFSNTAYATKSVDTTISASSGDKLQLYASNLLTYGVTVWAKNFRLEFDII